MKVDYENFVRKVQEASENQFTLLESKLAFQSVFAALKDLMLEGDEFSVREFGKFATKFRAAHEGMDPRNRERIIIPAHKIPYFEATKSFRKEIENT